jgi:hypothetical protein
MTTPALTLVNSLTMGEIGLIGLMFRLGIGATDQG